MNTQIGKRQSDQQDESPTHILAPKTKEPVMQGLTVKRHKLVLTDKLKAKKPRSGEVLVKVMCATFNPTDLDLVNGEYDFILRLMGGMGPVKSGLEFSGIVEQSSNRFSKGDRVFGYVSVMQQPKTHQEYISVNEDFVALMPKSLSFEEAAALPLGSLTTLVALEDVANVQTETRLLIIGASGGLGVYGIQFARKLDARITAVAGPNQEDFLQELGADRTIDYSKTDVLDLDQTFDVIFDLTTKYTRKQVSRLLSPRGKFIPADPMKNITEFVTNIFSRKKSLYLLVDRGDHDRLTRIAQYVDKGELKVFVDSVFDLEDFEAAIERLNGNKHRGRIVLKVSKDHS